MATQHFTVRGMHCASCATIIKKTLAKLPEVRTIDVNYATEIASIESTAPLSSESLNYTIKPFGYSLEADSSSDETSHSYDAATDDGSVELDILRSRMQFAFPLTALFFIVMIWDITSKFWNRLPAVPLPMNLFDIIAMAIATVFLFWIGRPFIVAVGRFITHRVANMDTLIGIGTLTAYIYSLTITLFPSLITAFRLPDYRYFDVTIVVIGFIVLGKYLEANAKARTNTALKSLVSLQVKAVIVERDGIETELAIENVVVGDRIIIKPGSRLPVDGRVISGESLVDESMLSGEPIPLLKQAGDMVRSGTLNQDGKLIIEATNIGEDSLLAHIIRLVQAAQGSRAPIQKLADTISGIFVPIVLVIAVVSLVAWLLIGSHFMPWAQALAFAISGFVGVLVIACPCALGLATPTAVIVGVGKGARNGILIKNAEALEKLSKIKDIIFDKTGTLTRGKPSVIGFANLSSRHDSEIVALANAIEKSSSHPLAHAITTFSIKFPTAKPQQVEKFNNYKGLGASAVIDGSEYYIGSDRFVAEKTGIVLDSSLLAQEKYAAATPIILAETGKALAYFFVDDEIKPESKIALKQFQARHIMTHLATGDRNETAEAVSRRLGIDSYRARMLPEDKHALVLSLQKSGRLVAVAGDGVNDAPALAAADVSIAMATGNDVAIDNADIILLHGDIGKISQAYVLSRQTLSTIKENLGWAFIFNVIGIPLAAGALYPFGLSLNPAFAGAAMAFSSVAVVLNSLRLKTKRI